METKRRLHLRHIERLTWIHAEIQAGRFPNTARIAERFEISRKTAQEIIAFMRDRFKLPLAYCAKRRGFHYEQPVHALPWMQLTQGEAVAILLAAQVAHAYGGALSAGIAAALHKVAETLTDTVSISLPELLAPPSVEPPPTSPVDAAHFRDLSRAVSARRRVKMTYHTQSSGETKTRTIDPLQLHTAKGEWYVIAFDHLRGAVRDFHLGRIRALEPLDETFTPPPGFDLERYLAAGFGMIRGGGGLQEVVVEFDAHQAGWIRQQSKVHPTAQYADLPDGGLRVTMRVGALEGVRMWVMQYGARARVIAPDDLREMVRREAAAMLAYYQATSAAEGDGRQPAGSAS